MNLEYLKNKTVIITGGARGIGREIALKFADYGCQLAILDIEDDAGQETVAELNEKVPAVYIHCDISSVKEIEASFAKTIEHYGCVHILINNAAIPVRDSLADITEEKWERFTNINMKSVFFFSKIFAEQVKEKRLDYSRIINISSLRAFVTDERHAGYSITKAAVNKITEMFAVTYGKYGLTANAVALGFIITPMTAHYFETPGMEETIKNMSPRGRAITPAEVASTVLFLSSPGAAAINGQTIRIDGGGVCHEGLFA